MKPPVGRVGDPCVMVIFGYAGDLTRRKLIPSLYNLAAQQLLSREFAVVGMGRSPMSNEDARKALSEDIKKFATNPVDPALWEEFVKRVSYMNGEFDDPATYENLKALVAKVDQENNCHGNCFFYLATAPSFFGDIVERLAKVGLMTEGNGHWRRVIIEKPFGHDLASAKALNAQLLKVATESQIYRIDHYLGKETVQNILALRFANGIFEPIWNRRYIDHVQISVAETVGVEKRGVPAYRSEEGVPPDSRTETYVAMRLMIDNWRWAGVPFYLRTAKRMPGRHTHVVIQFRKAPFMLFRETQVDHLMPNQMVLHIQPEEGISLRFAAKTPGTTMQLGEVNMDFNYEDYFGISSSTGYERLMHDCMIGDATLFQRADMVEAGWSIVNPALDVWKALPPRNFPNYAAGTWGPKEADELLERDGRSWRNFDK
jgi:glucose-6-phosphate 1-dehydrogenase